MNNVFFYQLLKKNAKQIIIVFLAGFMVMFGVSFLVTPLYKSVSSVYPINLSANSEESNTEQLLQYFLSEDVMQTIIRKHQLFERYGVDSLNDKNWRSLIKYYYNQHIKISPTMYESIEITVKDKDPFFARELNRSIIEETNLYIRRIKKSILKNYISNFNIGMALVTSKLDSLYQGADSLKNKSHAYVLKQVIKSYAKGMRKMSEEQVRNYGDFYGEVDFLIIVSSPSLNDKKVYPIRILWGILGGMSLSVLYIGLLLFRQNQF
ncbi:MAG: hypothetical protein N3F09_02860 [Bacteroidia bacterium]|nr:hypothetical protein [Bacteroidia bacterium]